MEKCPVRENELGLFGEDEAYDTGPPIRWTRCERGFESGANAPAPERWSRGVGMRPFRNDKPLGQNGGTHIARALGG